MLQKCGCCPGNRFGKVHHILQMLLWNRGLSARWNKAYDIAAATTTTTSNNNSNSSNNNNNRAMVKPWVPQLSNSRRAAARLLVKSSWPPPTEYSLDQTWSMEISAALCLHSQPHPHHHHPHPHPHPHHHHHHHHHHDMTLKAIARHHVSPSEPGNGTSKAHIS